MTYGWVGPPSHTGSSLTMSCRWLVGPPASLVIFLLRLVRAAEQSMGEAVRCHLALVLA